LKNSALLQKNIRSDLSADLTLPNADTSEESLQRIQKKKDKLQAYDQKTQNQWRNELDEIKALIERQ
jgi:hypothetical protein